MNKIELVNYILKNYDVVVNEDKSLEVSFGVIKYGTFRTVSELRQLLLCLENSY